MCEYDPMAQVPANTLADALEASYQEEIAKLKAQFAVIEAALAPAVEALNAATPGRWMARDDFNVAAARRMIASNAYSSTDDNVRNENIANMNAIVACVNAVRAVAEMEAK